MKTALIADASCKEHDTGPGHPESSLRWDAVMNALEDAKLLPDLLRLDARDATAEEITRVHTPAYAALAQHEIRAGADLLSTGDTQVGPHSWDAAVRAAGSAIAAVDAVCTGKARRAFCIVRPPGHHASPARGMGFCVLNNVAIAARHAQKVHGLGKMLIIDWDVHHGNGTQDVFYADPTVFFFSTHQSPWYPGTGAAEETGAGLGKGSTINVPLPAGSGRAAFTRAFEELLLPAADRFQPDMVLISAGFDSRLGDPLGQFTLDDGDFAYLTRTALGIAERHSAGRLVSVLEGGYNLDGVGLAAVSHVKALLV